MVDLLTPTRVTGPARSSSALTPGRARRYWCTLALLTVLALAAAVGLVTWDNPVPPGTRGFWIIVGLRAKKVLVIALVTFAHAIATVSFQTVTNNRILTPSIMGFESLYVVVQTGAVFFLGASGVVAISGVSQLLLQIGRMGGLGVPLPHACAAVSFQTVTNNRILTPSIMGFESLYVVVQTGAVFFLGASGVVAISGVSQFLLQIALMVGLAVLLYGWLLTGQRASL